MTAADVRRRLSLALRLPDRDQALQETGRIALDLLACWCGSERAGDQLRAELRSREVEAHRLATQLTELLRELTVLRTRNAILQARNEQLEQRLANTPEEQPRAAAETAPGAVRQRM
jgi:hypothetical protein